MFGVSGLGLLVSIFIVLNGLSVMIILAACIVSGRASRALEPHIEAKMISQRELAIAVSKLRVINPQPATAPAVDRHIIFSSENRRHIAEPVEEVAADNQAIAASQA